jgi:DNA adenine methylase
LKETPIKLVKPIKYPGGKRYLAPKIIKLFPPRRSDEHPEGYVSYVEPYAGGLSVLLANDPDGISEVVNDKNQGLMNFWTVLRDHFPAFRHKVEMTPFAQSFWAAADSMIGVPPSDPILWAWAYFVHIRQSLAGRGKDFASLTGTRIRGGMNEQASAWWNAIEGLEAVHDRLKRVVLLCEDAYEVIRKMNYRQTLFYLDPPYLPETRTSTGEYGRFEMSRDDHVSLLNLLGTIKGRFALSGYRSDVYDHFAECYKWNRVDFDVPNNASHGDTKERRTESVWRNYE